MPRTKTYERKDIVDAAMHRFWRHGDYATSIQDLVAATGVNRHGLYNEFTDKQGLFLSAVNHYIAQVVTTALAPVEADTAGVSEIRAFFALVLPALRSELAMVPDVAPVNLPVAVSWAIWDTIVVAIYAVMTWLVFQARGIGVRQAIGAGTLGWIFFFVLFWLGMVNMGLSSMTLALMALPLAWVEAVVASLILARAWRGADRGQPDLDLRTLKPPRRVSPNR